MARLYHDFELDEKEIEAYLKDGKTVYAVVELDVYENGPRKGKDKEYDIYHRSFSTLDAAKDFADGDCNTTEPMYVVNYDDYFNGTGYNYL